MMTDDTCRLLLQTFFGEQPYRTIFAEKAAESLAEKKSLKSISFSMILAFFPESEQLTEYSGLAIAQDTFNVKRQSHDGDDFVGWDTKPPFITFFLTSQTAN